MSVPFASHTADLQQLNITTWAHVHVLALLKQHGPLVSLNDTSNRLLHVFTSPCIAWTWLDSTGMQGDNGLFNDGLTKDGTCANNGQTQWTYNQGVVLVGLGYLYKYAKSEAAITAAFGIMDSIINSLTIDSGCARRITVEYMAWFLAITSRDDGTKYSDFVKLQADKVLENAASPMSGSV
ncbi:hypothetical protein BDZ89DRAFT_1167817 [Hymenopellis radicata]|nr:hypothetical protein BDZ89DRAFT_1167817 [Hymenopellis radicata]